MIQIILAALFVVLFLFFANPYYLGIPWAFATLHLVSISILFVFLWALRQQKSVNGVKIGLTAVGVITLPLGACAIAAAIAIAPTRRWCCQCGKHLRGASYIECPHCQASMHRLGRCRQNQFHHIASLLDYTPSQSEIEQICTNCLKVMSQPASGRHEDD